MTFDEGQGYVVLATVAVPLLAALILLFVPGSNKMAARYVSVFFGAIVLGLSIYIFVAYQTNHASDIQMQLKWTWVENTAFLGKNGIRLYLGVDGVSAPMALLTGVVAFAGLVVRA